MKKESKTGKKYLQSDEKKFLWADGFVVSLSTLALEGSVNNSDAELT